MQAALPYNQLFGTDLEASSDVLGLFRIVVSEEHPCAIVREQRVISACRHFNLLVLR